MVGDSRVLSGGGGLSIAPVQWADEERGVQVQPECRVERLGERAAEGVQQLHGLSQPEERQLALVPVQVDADARAGLGRHRDLTVVVPGGVAGVRAAQAPRVVVAAQQTGLAAALAPDGPVGHTHVHPPAALPLHLPVAGAAKLALLAQHLGHAVKAQRVRRVRLGLLAAVGTLGAVHQEQGRMCSFGVKGQATGICELRETNESVYYDGKRPKGYREQRE